MNQFLHLSPHGGQPLWVDLLDNPACLCQRILDLQKPPEVRELTNSGLAGVHRDTDRGRNRDHFVQQLFQNLFAFMNYIAVVGVPGVIPLALDDLDIVVHQDRVGDTGDLSNLISDIQVLVHKLFAGQQPPVDLVMLQGIENPVHADTVFFIGHIRNIDL